MKKHNIRTSAAFKNVSADKPKPSQKQEPKHVKTLADFRSQYDKDYIVPTRIKTALKILGNGWLSELEFAREAVVNVNDLRDYREQFIDHIVEVMREKRRIWVGSAKMAAQMREML